jgi:hypothetical protein
VTSVLGQVPMDADLYQLMIAAADALADLTMNAGVPGAARCRLVPIAGSELSTWRSSGCHRCTP